ncbi:MAG: aminotransferase [Pseudomonadota bacterium]
MSTASHDIAQADKKYVVHPFTNLTVHQQAGPITISRGEGIYVWDDHGNKLIEGMSGLWCTSLGFSESRLVEAATRQMRELPYSHMFTHRSTIPAIELCQRLVEIAPEGITRAYLVNSGSEAVDTAIKMVWFYHNAIDKPKKKRIISRNRAYHGVTIASGSLTALPYARDGFDLPAIDVLHCETPHHYRYAKDGESEEAFATRLAEELEAQIVAEDPDTIGGFIAEPVMGAGGALVPPVGYFDKIQAVLKKYDILLIADEVICGFGRTGNMWGSQTYDMQPDLITTAKQLSSAYLPIGGVLLNDKVYDGFVAGSDKLGMFGTGNTYGGHPVSCAVALETLNIYRDDKTIDNVRSVSPRFLERIKQLEQHSLVGNTRGVGLIGGLELVRDKASKEQYPASDKMAAQVMNAARANGVIVRAVPGDGVAFCPPLIINESQVDDMFDGVERALEDVAAALS